MLPPSTSLRSALGAAAATALLVVVLVAAPAAAAPSPLVGTFRLAAGSCEGGAPSGTYLRMILPTGSRTGPFLSNADSTCGDQTYTLLAPGTDGGLVTGGYQPEPSPGFDANGNSTANRITAPTGFFGVAFSASTNPIDPQTGGAAPAPSITADGSTLSGDLTAFAASWNNQEFNQGAPKPGGALPGNTALATGTYDPTSGAFTLEWASQVEGGPFDRFTGLWHLEGTFVPATGPAGATGTTAAAPAAGGGGGTATAAPTAAAAGSAANPVPAGAAGAGDASTSITTAGTVVAATPRAATAAETTTRTEAGEDGWAPPGWLVVLVALIGLGAFATYIRLERVVRGLEAST